MKNKIMLAVSLLTASMIRTEISSVKDLYASTVKTTALVGNGIGTAAQITGNGIQASVKFVDKIAAKALDRIVAPDNDDTVDAVRAVGFGLHRLDEILKGPHFDIDTLNNSIAVNSKNIVNIALLAAVATVTKPSEFIDQTLDNVTNNQTVKLGASTLLKTSLVLCQYDQAIYSFCENVKDWLPINPKYVVLGVVFGEIAYQTYQNWNQKSADQQNANSVSATDKSKS